MYEASTAAVDGAGEEGHPDGALVGNSLKGADQVSTFKVLARFSDRGFYWGRGCKLATKWWEGLIGLPSIHVSIDLEVHQICQYHQRGLGSLP